MYCDVCGFCSVVSRDLPSSLTAALAHPGNAPFTLHCQQLIYMSDDSVCSHELALCRKHFWALLSVMYVKHVPWSINVQLPVRFLLFVSL